MQQRGLLTRQYFSKRANMLGEQSSFFSLAAASATGDVHALAMGKSRRLPAGEDTFSMQSNLKRRVCALSAGSVYSRNDEDQEDRSESSGEEGPHNHIAALQMPKERLSHALRVWSGRRFS